MLRTVNLVVRVNENENSTTTRRVTIGSSSSRELKHLDNPLYEVTTPHTDELNRIYTSIEKITSKGIFVVSARSFLGKKIADNMHKRGSDSYIIITDFADKYASEIKCNNINTFLVNTAIEVTTIVDSILSNTSIKDVWVDGALRDDSTVYPSDMFVSEKGGVDIVYEVLKGKSESPLINEMSKTKKKKVESYLPNSDLKILISTYKV